MKLKAFGDENMAHLSAYYYSEEKGEERKLEMEEYLKNLDSKKFKEFMEWKDGKIGELIREILPKQIHCKGTRNRLIGTHTYSATEDFEIIDIEYLVRKKKFKKKRYWK